MALEVAAGMAAINLASSYRVDSLTPYIVFLVYAVGYTISSSCMISCRYALEKTSGSVHGLDVLGLAVLYRLSCISLFGSCA